MPASLCNFAFIGLHDALLEAADLKIRLAGAAGSFYPADPAELTSTIDDFLAKAAVPPIEGPILAVVAPHAGYVYSGPVAAYSYGALKGRTFGRVVVIAPSHFESFGFTSVYGGDGYSTPLGTVKVDKGFTRRLAGMRDSIKLSDQGHRPKGQQAEHALEVQLPWLQRVLGEFSLVPVVMGDQSYESSRDLGVSLARILAKESEGSTLIVASSDLSHYHTYDEAVRIDDKTLVALQSWDYFSMSRNLEERVWEACGGAPIVAAMIAVEREGANDAMLLHYANSGDAGGDQSRVVGYGALAFIKEPPHHVRERSFPLSASDKHKLIKLARASVEDAIRNRKAYDAPIPPELALNRESGAFVTLKKGGALRGCIGYTSASKPLYETVRDAAALAAFSDPRFPPVTAEEVGRLEYEVSVLSPLRRVQDVRQIQIGKHGLLIKNGRREGLLLPQVATAQHWDRVRFLEQTCAKAGMPEHSWKEEDTDIFCFTAEVFGEDRSAGLSNSSPDRRRQSKTASGQS